MQLWQYCLLVSGRSLYMFRTLSVSIIRRTALKLQPTLDILNCNISSRHMECTSECYYSF